MHLPVLHLVGRMRSFSRGKWRGEDHFQCVDCTFDSLDISEMNAHCEKTGHSEVDFSVSDLQFMQEQEKPLSVIITLVYLCWNTAEASAEGLTALILEARRLRTLGATVDIHALDNGSTDDTYALLCAVRDREGFADLRISRFESNRGISAARNFLINAQVGQTYILLMDGDIEVVPFSVHTMARYLECHPEVGCIGAYSGSFSDDRAVVSPRFTEILEHRVKGDIFCAWTQYGLFRASMFSLGLVFDERGPMGVPGWGFEDTDLYLAMTMAKFQCRYFGGMVYLHRALHSSWKYLPDLVPVFQARKEYLLTKWAALGLDPGILNILSAQQLPG